MMNIRVTTKFSGIRGLTRRQQRDMRDLPKEFVKVVKDNTPIDSGNARRNTSLIRSALGKFTVRSHYPYAKRLDEGWSKQAKNGFVQPSLDWLRDRIKQIFGGR